MILDAEKLGKDHSKTESGQLACENQFSQASPSYGEVIDCTLTRIAQACRDAVDSQQYGVG